MPNGKTNNGEKLTKEQRKAEEARALAAMDEALASDTIQGSSSKASPDQKTEGKSAEKLAEKPAENTEEKPKADKAYGVTKVPMPAQMHCRRCGAVMENGECKKCGYKVYVPTDEAKLKKIRLIVGTVCLVAAVILWIVLR